MIRALASGLLAAVFAATAGAQASPSPKPAPRAKPTVPASAGPAAPAVDYAQQYSAVCTACHGLQGRSDMPLVPSLAGQHSSYVITQLFLFREGRRQDHPLSAAMVAVAKGLSDNDLRGYSESIAKLPKWTAAEVAGIAAAPAADLARWARGQRLADGHRCASCHGTDYAGGGQVPRLAQQREDYLQIALKGFRSGARLGYTPAMNEALVGIDPASLDDLAHYLAHFVAHHAGQAPAAR